MKCPMNKRIKIPFIASGSYPYKEVTPWNQLLEVGRTNQQELPIWLWNTLFQKIVQKDLKPAYIEPSH
jgi:hypothetical protein